MPSPHMLVPIKIFVILLPLHLLRLTRNVDKAIQGSTFAIFCKPHFVPLSIPQAQIICQIMLKVFKIYFNLSAKTWQGRAGECGDIHVNTSYLTDSYIVFTLKMESVSKNTIFGLKMMVKNGLEKFILKSLHAGRQLFLLLNL